MDGKKIGQLIEAKELMGAEVLPCSYNGVTRRVSIDTLTAHVRNQPCLTFLSEPSDNTVGTDRGKGRRDYLLKVDNPGIFEVGDIILFPTVSGTNEAGESMGCLIAIVSGFESRTHDISISPCNGPVATSLTGPYTSLPILQANIPVVRIGQSFFLPNGWDDEILDGKWHNSAEWK